MASGLALDAAAWSSPWRTRSVRDKAVLSGGLLLAAVALPPVPGAAAVAAVSLALLLGPVGVRPGLLARLLWAPALSIALGVASVAVSVGWAAGPTVAVTRAGLATAGALTLRAGAATLALLTLACSTPTVDLFEAARRARMPGVLVEISSLTYRFAVELVAAAGAVHAAQEARLGFVDRRATLRSASLAVSALFLRSWTRARRLDEGLAGRGYTDSLATLQPPRRRSAGFVAASLALLAGLTAGSLVTGGWA